MALRRKARVSCLFLVDRDAVGILELLVELARLLATQEFREELDATGPVDSVQEDQIGHALRVEVEEPFPHLVGFEEDGSVRGPAAEKSERRLVQRVPALFDGAGEAVQFAVGGDAELDVQQFNAIEEGNFEETGLRFDDHLVFAAREDFAGHFKAACASLKGNLGTIVNGLGEAAEGQVPFHRIDAGHSGEEEQIGIRKETVARVDHDAGAAHL